MHLRQRDGEKCFYKVMMLGGLQFFDIKSHFSGSSVLMHPVVSLCVLHVGGWFVPEIPCGYVQWYSHEEAWQASISSLHLSMHALQVHFCKNRKSCEAPAMG